MAMDIRSNMMKFFLDLAVHLVAKYFSPLDGTKSYAVGLLRDRCVTITVKR